MKITKEKALETIKDVELTEYLMFTSDILDPMMHVTCCQIFQRLKQLAIKSTLLEFEGEP
jgi:hypothetical protein